VPHIFGNISIRATTLLEISLQLEVYIRNYVLLKWWESQFREFQEDSELGSLGENDIWV
jgi:hypothetical protein